MINPPTVFIIDDDESVGLALQRMLRAAGYAASVWTDGNIFLAEHDTSLRGCVVTDLLMPGMSGLDLLSALTSGGCSRPVIVITASEELAVTAAACPDAPFKVLSKPVTRNELLDAVNEAILKDAVTRSA